MKSSARDSIYENRVSVREGKTLLSTFYIRKNFKRFDELQREFNLQEILQTVKISPIDVTDELVFEYPELFI